MLVSRVPNLMVLLYSLLSKVEGLRGIVSIACLMLSGGRKLYVLGGEGS